MIRHFTSVHTIPFLLVWSLVLLYSSWGKMALRQTIRKAHIRYFLTKSASLSSESHGTSNTCKTASGTRFSFGTFSLRAASTASQSPPDSNSPCPPIDKSTTVSQTALTLDKKDETVPSANIDTEIKVAGNTEDVIKIVTRYQDMLSSSQLHALLCKVAGLGGDISTHAAMICARLLCKLGKPFGSAEDKAPNTVSHLPLTFLSSIAKRLVSECPDGLDDEVAVVEIVAKEVLQCGNSLPVETLSFVVGCVIACGYRDKCFLSGVREITIEHMRSWIEPANNFHQVSILLNILLRHSKPVDNLVLLESLRKNLTLVKITCDEPLPNGFGALLKILSVRKKEPEPLVLERLVQTLQQQVEYAGFEDLAWILSFSMKAQHPPSPDLVEKCFERMMRMITNADIYAVVHVLFLTRSVSTTYSDLLPVFNKEGVIRTLYEHLKAQMHELAVFQIAQCVIQFNLLKYPSSGFLSKASAPIIDKANQPVVSRQTLLALCKIYAWSTVPESRDVVNAVGRKLWEDLPNLTSKEVLELLRAHWKTGVCPPFSSVDTDVILRCENELSGKDLHDLHRFLESDCFQERSELRPTVDSILRQLEKVSSPGNEPKTPPGKEKNARLVGDQSAGSGNRKEGDLVNWRYVFFSVCVSQVCLCWNVAKKWCCVLHKD